MAPSPSLAAFTAPICEFCVVHRDRTNTPLQALVTLNDPQFVEAARHLAQLAIQHADDEDGVLDYLTDQVLCRPITETEREILHHTKADFLAHYQARPDDARALVAVGESAVSDQLDAIGLAAWTMVANLVLCLDEVVTKN
mgnify:CR=1 FL=1